MSDEKEPVNKELCELRHAFLDEKLGCIFDKLDVINGKLDTLTKERAWAAVGRFGMVLLAISGTLFGILKLFRGP